MSEADVDGSRGHPKFGGKDLLHPPFIPSHLYSAIFIRPVNFQIFLSTDLFYHRMAHVL